MGRIRQVHTTPELAVRRAVHNLGMRYTVHNRDLPGSPDVANRRRRWAMFVHGCFWHQHKECREGRLPESNRDYWEPKLARNVERDDENLNKLNEQGWRTLVIWECETQNEVLLRSRLRCFLR